MTVKYIRCKNFGGIFKIEILESPPTITIVAYYDENNRKITPKKLVRMLKKGELPYIYDRFD